MSNIVQIKHRYSGVVLFECDVPEDVDSGLRMRYALERATIARAYLKDANLSGAYLSGAYLAGAYLSGASLSGAYLSGAYLSGVYLAGANLAGANLSSADLNRADLNRADLSGANLAGANLSGANLARAYLKDANLAGANLSGAYLARAKDADYAIAQTRILPEGDLIGYKKLQNDSIAKVRIPSDARRSSAFGRKCRAEYVDVLEGEGVSTHDGITKYAPGLRVTCDKWEEDWTQECAGGIHFFITRLEAENY